MDGAAADATRRCIGEGHDRNESVDCRLVTVVAFTGAVAGDVRGRTIHSVWRPGGTLSEENNLSIQECASRTIMCAVDERSMISSVLFGQTLARSDSSR